MVVSGNTWFRSGTGKKWNATPILEPIPDGIFLKLDAESAILILYDAVSCVCSACGPMSFFAAALTRRCVA